MHPHGVPGARRLFSLGLALALSLPISPPTTLAQDDGGNSGQPTDTSQATPPTVMWIDHLSLLPGDASLKSSFNAVSSGVGTGLSGLVIQSTTTGSQALGGGNKVVERGLDVPPGFTIQAVRVCYESTSGGTSIIQIRLAQVQDPPARALVLLDDGTVQPAPGPVCVTSASTNVDPSQGAVLLSLRLNFNAVSDKLVIRGLGLVLTPPQ
jgi:hypothetical protein